MPVKIVNNISKFIKYVNQRTDLSLSMMAVDILRMSKAQVPVSSEGGQLKSKGMVKRRAVKSYRISYDSKYAAYQHRGMRKDGTRVVRRYSTPGTKKNYLQDPADRVLSRKRDYIMRALAR